MPFTFVPAKIAAASVATIAAAALAAPPAAAEVPLGGLPASFVGNQVTYCSIICPLAVQTVVTAAVTAPQAPAVFLASAQSGDPMRAIGAAAASVTGPTNDAFAATILADGSLVAPRALNAFETGVVGVLDVIPAVGRGPRAVLAAIQSVREETFDALHAPIVPNPTPTVEPRGALQVVVIGVIDVGAAVAFPAFNAVLATVTSVPNAVAQELAATGDPVRAVAAGVETAGQAGTTAVTSVSRAVRQVVDDVVAPREPLARSRSSAAPQKPSPPTNLVAAVVPSKTKERPDRDDATKPTAKSDRRERAPRSERGPAHRHERRSAKNESSS